MKFPTLALLLCWTVGSVMASDSPSSGPTVSASASPSKSPTAAPVPPPSPAPIVTQATETPAPATPAPATPAPVTPAPVTPAPVTPAPVTPAPVTPAPVTPAPVTPAPVTPAPVTPAPVTPAPVTPAPITPAPVTPAPVTSVPVTLAPATDPPVSAFPSESPTLGATMNATTWEPSAYPSLAPSAFPSLMPSASPTMFLHEETAENLYMDLYGITDLPSEDQETWSAITAGYQEIFYQTVSANITQLNITVAITGVIVPAGSMRGRRLDQTSYVTVIYNQEMIYYTEGETAGPLELATAPFATQQGRDYYLSLLQASNQGVLVDIESTSDVVADATFSPTSAPTPGPTAQPTVETPSPTSSPTAPGGDGGDGGEDGLSTGVIIGIAVGGGVVLIACLLCLFFRSGDSDDYAGANDPPPNVHVKTGDEVSAMAPPAYGNTPTSNISIGYGDQSVATVDYDYSKAYGGGGDTSVSSAGGTFGSHTQGHSILDPATAGKTGAALGGAGSFSDSDSFGVGGGGFRGQNSNTKEVLLNIFAPPGKLGVVIDTPDDGAPVVHAVKDSSVIAGEIQVGDKLVAVDDEDVRTMTAIKVSKLISRKSANPSRKLSIIRSTLID
eukprot:Nitzschia sp. Nitz4//scaffold261_size27179//1287//3203//NITZ4_008204-RA/size27179-snap-gene-0.3-mRNA-1//1//CDS//3329544702//1269//frame0